MKISKLLFLLTLIYGLVSCSEEMESDPDLKLQAQKKLEAEAKEIQNKARARIEFKEKHCKDLRVLECKKLMKEAGVARKGKDLY